MHPKFLLTFILSLPAWLMSCFNAVKVTSSPIPLQNIMKDQISSFYALKAVSLDGQTISMDQYKGKKVIILNVASHCGFTSQYADWEAFYEKNKDSVVVLGFPCNQFLGQEPGTAEEIGAFCKKNYGVTFPMFEKIDVKGNHQSPVYAWLTNPALNGWNSDEPSWNFCKYLIDENGRLTHFFASKIKPESHEFIAAMSK